jgi:hypothetical protein
MATAMEMMTATTMTIKTKVTVVAAAAAVVAAAAAAAWQERGIGGGGSVVASVAAAARWQQRGGGGGGGGQLGGEGDSLAEVHFWRQPQRVGKHGGWAAAAIARRAAT